MVRKVALGSLIAGVCAMTAGSALADNRISASKKGSLLIYSKVELKWLQVAPEVFVPIQDTILDIGNDYPEDVKVQFYFVNGDPPLDEVCDPMCPLIGGRCPEECIVERAHTGWNWVDCEILLTANQPTFLEMLTGNRLGGAGCQPFTELDPGFPPGRPDPDNPRLGRVLRGFAYAWAVKNDPEDGQNRQIRWNHLLGDAAIVNFFLATAAEYNAYAAAVVERPGGPANGDFVGTAGVINLNGVEYDSAFARLLLDFYASGSIALSSEDVLVIVDTDITLHPISADLRQETNGPIKTKAKFDIWNENEIRFSGTEICVECWNQTLASRYPAPNHLLLSTLGTDKGKARIEGIASNIPACPLAVDAALLGVSIKEMVFCNEDDEATAGLDITECRDIPDGFATSAITLVGQGEKNATIMYDLVGGSDEAQGLTGSAGIGTPKPVKTGRTGR